MVTRSERQPETTRCGRVQGAPRRRAPTFWRAIACTVAVAGCGSNADPGAGEVAPDRSGIWVGETEDLSGTSFEMVVQNGDIVAVRPTLAGAVDAGGCSAVASDTCTPGGDCERPLSATTAETEGFSLEGATGDVNYSISGEFGADDSATGVISYVIDTNCGPISVSESPWRATQIPEEVTRVWEGSWAGIGAPDTEPPLVLLVEDGMVTVAYVSSFVGCQSTASFLLAPDSPIEDGHFRYSTDYLVLEGDFLTATTAAAFLTLSSCGETVGWVATRPLEELEQLAADSNSGTAS